MSRKPPAVYQRAPIPASYPEHANYVDKGCHLHPSCLRCPLPECIYDTVRDGRVPNRRELEEQQKREEMRRLHQEGYTIYDIMAALNVSERTVQRAINGGAS